ncbi:MAG: hypothetical protein ABIR39_03120 [Nocardioides sp.]|uniref:hypothetical protein n=1 Tax=Nocardioides sp. TaxID=35761 RepID=UPI003264192F
MTADLREALADHLDRVVAPTGDLSSVMRSGRRIRTRRRAIVAGAVAAVLVVGGFATTQLMGSPKAGSNDGQVATDPALAQGLRAYADPGRVMHYGDRSADISDLEWLDTDAAATANGVVYYDAGRPMLLGLDGTTKVLYDGEVEDRPDFHPTAKADPTSAQVAVAVWTEGAPRLLVVDTATGARSISLACAGCDPFVIEAFDDGVVFYRTSFGTVAQEASEPGSVNFAGPETRIADVRNGVVLYDGQPPAQQRPVGDRTYRFVPGAIDSQLTHDGQHVLAWSSTLAATFDAPPLQLSVTEQDGARQWTIDTDGSILVASSGGAGARFHDCDVVTGACERIGELEMTGGDPLFLGNDM